jgi:hypothetical protein
VLLSQEIAPTFDTAALSHVLFSVQPISGGTAGSQSGSFAEESVVYLNAADDDDYLVNTGFDANGDGTLEEVEVQKLADDAGIKFGSALTDKIKEWTKNYNSAAGA